MRIPLLLTVFVALLYLPRLGSAPIYLAPDEAVVGVEAHALAVTGRDAFHQRLLPLYFEYNRVLYDPAGGESIRNSWLPPAIFYATALTVKILPFSEFAIRLPTVAAGIASILLLYFVARRLFHNEWLAATAAVLLALTPSHFIHSRLATDYLYPVPFMLAWLLLLLRYRDGGRERDLFASTLCLGIGIYSYAAATVVMPLYLVMTLAVLLNERRPLRAYVIAVAGFLIPASLCIPWLVLHRTMIGDVLTKYEMTTPGQATLLQNVRSMLTYHRIGDQIALYWGFFNPRFLFFDGPMEMMFSTREVGVFLLPVGVLLIAGLVAILRGPFSSTVLLLVAGFVTAPLAATIVNINDAIYRALEMLPWAALLAAFGAAAMWSFDGRRPGRRTLLSIGIAIVALGLLYGLRIAVTQSRVPGAAVPLVLAGAIVTGLAFVSDRLRAGQLIVIGLLALVPLQFAAFYRDYFTDYRRRSAMIFSGNLRGAFEEMLAQDASTPAPAIYLGQIGNYSTGGEMYWRFYLIKHGREELLARTIEAHRFHPDRIARLPDGSLIVNNAGDNATDAVIDAWVAEGNLTRTFITEPDGTKTYVVLRRTGRKR